MDYLLERSDTAMALDAIHDSKESDDLGTRMIAKHEADVLKDIGQSKHSSSHSGPSISLEWFCQFWQLEKM